MELKKQSILVLVVSQLALLALPQSASAGPLLDWLLRRRANRTTAYYPGACNTCSDGSYCEQTVVQYVPQVAYRTVWQPVPVTTYQKTVSCNPATGLPIECTKPCTSYTYQARRVPYTTYRPVYGKVPVCGNNNTVAAMPISSTTTSYAPAASCCGSSSWLAGNYATPSYSTPSYTSPGYTNPGYSAPNSYSPNPYSAPGYNGGQPTPADNADPNVRPRLAPDMDSMSMRVRRLPSTSQRSIVQAENAMYAGQTRGVAVFSSEDNPASQMSESAESFLNERRQQPAAVGSFDETLNGLKSRSLQDLRPLPSNAGGASLNVPPMLNDDDRTAVRTRIPSRYKVKPIEWPKVIQASYVRSAEPEVRLDSNSQIEVRRLPSSRTRSTQDQSRHLPTRAERAAMLRQQQDAQATPHVARPKASRPNVKPLPTKANKTQDKFAWPELTSR
ncbi:MAG: hypothetical protein R3C28_00135 [Pirellulaceae bacterium]